MQMGKVGWVSKESKSFKTPSRRYLVLDGSTLSHYFKEDGPPSWKVDIHRVRVTVGENPLQFNLSVEGQSVSFLADTRGDLISWISVLKSRSCVLEDFYIIGEQLGKGSYGDVFICTDKLTGQQNAVKVINKNPKSTKQKRFIDRERSIMTKVCHPHIVRTVDVFEDQTRLAIVSEFMEGGELFAHIVDAQYFSEQVSVFTPTSNTSYRNCWQPVYL